jgi:hypothetical protein
VNLAQDDELMALFRRAGFAWVFLGIESPDVTSLKETKKFQNTRQDLLSAVRRIYANGIEVLGGFIVGFDNDTADTFEQQYRFITESGIQGAMVGLLTALPKTPLYHRLKKEGRLLPDSNDSDNTKRGTNVIPLRMKYDEMVERYRGLCTRLMAYRNIADRIRNKVRFIRTPPAAGDDTWIARIRIIHRLLFRGLLPGGVPRMFHFLRSMPFHRPKFIPLAVQDWIVGLSMRDSRSHATAWIGSSGPSVATCSGEPWRCRWWRRRTPRRTSRSPCEGGSIAGSSGEPAITSRRYWSRRTRRSHFASTPSTMRTGITCDTC